MEGHLLLIPKKHFDCYLNLDKNLIDEFNLFKNKVIEFLKKYYQKPVIFEHGIAGQTVFHAHLHFLPTKILITKQIKEVAKVVKTPKIPYLYYEFNNKRNIISQLKK
jgi:diadenosine tetraphosphate (Ap4A) HIT family hydrolase